MKRYASLYFTLLLSVGVLTASPTLARDRSHAYTEAAISSEDRDILRSYLRENYHPHCPPGLAKKHNGCLPPGIAKKYRLGEPLPEGIAYRRLPDDILDELHAAPGSQYVQVDQDVLLVSQATQQVLDAVTLLSSVK